MKNISITANYTQQRKGTRVCLYNSIHVHKIIIIINHDLCFNNK